MKSYGSVENGYRQGPTVHHIELCLGWSGSLDGRGVWWRVDRPECKTQSLGSSSEAAITLLISYIRKQNSLKKWIKPSEVLTCEERLLKASSDRQRLKIPITQMLFWEEKSFFFFFISWRLITLQYCSGFCHTLTWISHGRKNLWRDTLIDWKWTKIKKLQIGKSGYAFMKQYRIRIT